MITIPAEKLTVVEFIVFDKQSEKVFYNSTVDQCCKYIFGKIWETAQIKKITEYYIKECGVKNVSIIGINNKENYGKNRK